jgi:hypothetical protein
MTNIQETLEGILKEAYGAEAYHDGYTIGVREDEEDLKSGYTVYIQKSAMPPHFSQFRKTLSEVESVLRSTHFPVDQLQWEAVEGEE